MRRTELKGSAADRAVGTAAAREAGVPGTAGLPGERSWLREGATALLLFMLLREWLLPIAELSEANEQQVMGPLLTAIGCFLLADCLRLHWLPGAVLKLLTAWFCVGWLYDAAAVVSFRWPADYAAVCLHDIEAVLRGDPGAVGGENRTLLFLIGWALLAGVIQSVFTYKKQSLWFVFLTLLYLIGLQLWPGLDTTGAIVRALLFGLMLMALLQLPRIEQTFAAKSGTAGWPFGWLAVAAMLVCLSAVIGMTAAAAQPREVKPLSEESWERLLERLSAGAAGDAISTLSGSGAPLAAKTGYGNDDTKLGQPLRTDDGIVFVARTTQPTYWRGESKSVYTGQGWIGLDEETELRPYPNAAGPKTAANFASEASAASLTQGTEGNGTLSAAAQTNGSPAGTIVQEVMFNRGSKGDQLFAGGLIAGVERMIADSGKTIAADALYWNERSGRYVLRNGVDPLAYYRVEAIPAVSDPQRLRAESAEYPDPIRAAYLQLPDSLPKRVSELAASIAARAGSVYDKAAAISDYLQTHYVYSLEKPRLPAGRGDFVDAFLFEQKVGYCDHFSTAMVVMLRSLGIPARWVKGYAPGELSPAGDSPLLYGSAASDHPDSLAMTAVFPADQTVYQTTVRNRNAHSWVEVYFPDSGWVTFEPTPGFAGAAAEEKDAGGVKQVSDSTAASGGEPLPWIERLKGLGAGFTGRWSWAAVSQPADAGVGFLQARAWPIAAGLALLAPLLLLVWLQRKRLGLWLLLRGLRQREPDRLQRVYDKLWLRLFRTFGSRRPHETLREYALSRVGIGDERREALIELTRLYEAFRYDSRLVRTLPKPQIAELWSKLLVDRAEERKKSP
ncbi:transglutaminaseTgpA domain-containing protein [Paenibacillus sp. MBLB4367]|uniref:transglutaminase family protein n=1 Tax=Paenibacillus sp. MBLB4367 TaxID=3384767 RepID=UPI00390841EB